MLIPSGQLLWVWWVGPQERLCLQAHLPTPAVCFLNCLRAAVHRGDPAHSCGERGPGRGLRLPPSWSPEALGSWARGTLDRKWQPGRLEPRDWGPFELCQWQDLSTPETGCVPPFSVALVILKRIIFVIITVSVSPPGLSSGPLTPHRRPSFFMRVPQFKDS